MNWFLADGQVVPIVSGSCVVQRESLGNHKVVSNGYVGPFEVQVLRDSGCTGAAVKEDLVRLGQWTGRSRVCKMFDSTHRVFRTANITADTRYYTGKLEAMVVKNPILRPYNWERTGSEESHRIRIVGPERKGKSP